MVIINCDYVEKYRNSFAAKQVYSHFLNFKLSTHSRNICNCAMLIIRPSYYGRLKELMISISEK